jgi:precorrin-4/cobalt-precorrin-4 C11-methyltransferase
MSAAGGRVWFVGAGPGDPDLITVKGRALLAEAGAVLYAGSLVSAAALRWTPEDCAVADSKGMDLEAISDWLIAQARRHRVVVRLQTGDPSLYGALIEMVRPLDAAGIEVGVVPGVSSAMASAAAAVESLILPAVTQSVILTRIEGRTPVPAREGLESLARHHCTLCLFLSVTALDRVQAALRGAGWAEQAPVTVVHKATWPGEERVLRTTLGELEARCRAEAVHSQAMIIASPTLGARHWPSLTASKLYDAGFSHGCRRADADEPQTQIQIKTQTRRPPMTTTLSEQATAAGRRIEHDSFATIDREVGRHDYGPEQWPIVRRLIHASADFELNGLTRFHPAAVDAGIQAILAGRPIVADVAMICVGLSRARLKGFGLQAHQFIDDPAVCERARARDSTRAVQAMRLAREQGLIDGGILAIGNAPTALLEVLRLVREQGARPALIVGMPVGFVSAAESKAALAEVDAVPWITIAGRKGGSTLVVAALHALMALAEQRRQAGR